jgi:hypothetical protein
LFSFQARGHGSADWLEAPKRPRAERLLGTCSGCHARKEAQGGIHSVATLYAGDPHATRGLIEATDKDQTEATVRWTRKTYTWGLLQGLWGPPSKE